MNKKILKVKFPTITSWNWQAALFSVIEISDKSYPWIYNNYIQIHCNPVGPNKNQIYLDFCYCSGNALLSCPFLHTQHYNRDIFNSFASVKEFIVFSIDSGYCIYLYIKESRFIRNLGLNPFYHELFIYGYDLENNIFYVSDFTFTGTYSRQTVPMDKVCSGILDIDKKHDYLLENAGGVLLLKYQDCKYEFDKLSVYQLFGDYLYGRNSFEHIRYKTHDEIVFGLNSYPMITKHIHHCSELHIDQDVRLFHNLFDHKVLMVKRLNYYMKIGLLDINPYYLENAINIKDWCNHLWLIALKDNLRGKFSSTEILCDLVQHIENTEYQLYTVIFKELKEKLLLK